MKKKILALTMAGVTAFSVLGGLPVGAATSTGIRDTLLSMYSNENGNSSTSYIQSTYTGSAYSNAVYLAADYRGTAAWDELTSDTIYFDLDSNGREETYWGVYALAYKAYSGAYRYTQDAVDMANDMLISTLQALSSNKWSPSMSIGNGEGGISELQSIYDIVDALNESDFNTTAASYRSLTTAMTRAKTVLGKSKPTKSEITTAINNLTKAYGAVFAAVKPIGLGMRKMITNAVTEAKELCDSAGNSVSAKQILDLKQAAAKAENEEYGTALDARGSVRVILVSDATKMLDELHKAIEAFSAPVGWYQENGGWYFGEDGGNYQSRWLRNKTGWYYFTKSGRAVQSDWVQYDWDWYYFDENCRAVSGWKMIGGSWYYFDSANVMAANTTVGGYKLGADGRMK